MGVELIECASAQLEFELDMQPYVNSLLPTDRTVARLLRTFFG